MKRIFNSLKISQWIIIALILIVAIIESVNLITMLNSQNQLITDQENEQLKSLTAAFNEKILSEGQTALNLAAAFADMPIVQEAFARQDRQALIDLLEESYLKMNEEFGVPQAQFHLAPATSFLRLHDLEKFGDDLSSFRATVLAANKDLKPIAGLEKGKGGYGIRGVEPVFYNGKHIGSFEMAANFDQAFLKDFSATYNSEVSIYLREDQTKVTSFEQENAQNTSAESVFTLYASTLKEPISIPESIRQKVYDTGQAQVTRLVADGQPYAVITAPLFDYTNAIVGIIEIEISREAAIAQMNDGRNRIIILGLVILIGVAGAGWLVLNWMLVKPIQRLTKVAEAISIGDLSHSISTTSRRDEIGLLSNSFNQMILYLQNMTQVAQKIADGDLTVQLVPAAEQDVLGNALVQMLAQLKSLLTKIVGHSASLSSSTELVVNATNQTFEATNQIYRTIEQVAIGTHKQSDSMQSASLSITQLSNSITGIAQGSQEQASAITRAAELTNQINKSLQNVVVNASAGSQSAAEAATTSRNGARIVEQTIDSMQKIRDKVSLSTEKVDEMGQRSEQISMIVETIDEIASQINLLALNAAIEAARAGEHGKGFSVVADEVRKLAEKSAEATREIRDLVLTIQHTVNEAVRVMKESSEEVAGGVQKANRSKQALNDILTVAERVVLQVNEITQSATGIESSAEELARSMETVSAVVEENTATTEEMAASSREISQSIEQVASVSSNNSTTLQEVSQTTHQINDQVSQVTESARELADMAREMNSIVTQFRLEE